MIIVPNVSLLVQAAAVKVASLDGGSLRLYKNDISPSALSVVGDFTVADFTGYANKTIATWGDPFIDSVGACVSLAGLETFAATGSGTANTVYGCYYLDSGGGLVWAARFAAPANFAGAGDTLAFVPKFTFGQGS